MENEKNLENENIENAADDTSGHIVTADELVMDEAAIIREQDRLEKEKKKKKSAKKKKIALGIVILLVILAIVYLVWGRKLLNKEKEVTITIEKTAAQSVKYVKVNSINGNEINYTVLEAVENETTTESSEEPATSSESSERPSRDSMPSMPSGGDGSFDPSSMPSMPSGGDGSFDPSSMPSMPSEGDGSFDPSSMPSMPSGGDGSFDPSSMPSMPSGEDGSERPSFGGSRPDSDTASSEKGASAPIGKGQNSKRSQSSVVLTYNDVNYSLTDESATTMIPVGVVVTTKLGTETTFSRISAGDCLALVTEMIDGVETIISVYIVG